MDGSGRCAGWPSNRRGELPRCAAHPTHTASTSDRTGTRAASSGGVPGRTARPLSRCAPRALTSRRRVLRPPQGPGGLQHLQQLGLCPAVGHLRGRSARADEIAPGPQSVGVLGEEGPQTPSRPVPFDGGAAEAVERERHTRSLEFGICCERHPQQLAAEAATAAQRCEVGPAAARIDQALSRCRPLRLRAFTIARPARVDMRWRKPCRRARLRLWGWYVRFTLQSPGGSGRAQVREMRCGVRSVPGVDPRALTAYGR